MRYVRNDFPSQGVGNEPVSGLIPLKDTMGMDFLWEVAVLVRWAGNEGMNLGIPLKEARRDGL